MTNGTSTYTAIVTSVTVPGLETCRRGPFATAGEAADWAASAYPERPATIVTNGTSTEAMNALLSGVCERAREATSTEPTEATDAVCQHCDQPVEWARVNGWGTFVHTATGDQDCPASAAPILYRGERYRVTVETVCPIVAEPCEGVRVYGPGVLAVRSVAAPSWAPSLVPTEPLESNGVYLTLGPSAPWGGAEMVAARWLIAQGYREESGRIADAGRAALYAS